MTARPPTDATAAGPRVLTDGPAAGWTLYPDGRLVSPCGTRTIRTRGDGFNCCDCGVDTAENNESYMVHDGVWAQASAVRPLEPNRRGATMLCVGCIEARLGRTLTAADFKPGLPLNDPGLDAKSERLLDRMGR